MSRKYSKLTDFLKAHSASKIRLSFSELEEIVGFTLPASANQYQAWWSNNPRSQSLGWLEAGWRTTNLDLAEELVTFVRNRGNVDDESKPSQMFTIAEAKQKLAETFGVEPAQVEITIRA